LTPQLVFDTDNDSTLEAVWDKIGLSNTLYAQWKEPKWGQTNIYFKPDASSADGSFGSLTFLEKGATEQEKGYQGLYFKWGSLIGLSAAVEGNINFSAAYLYIPDRDTGKYYKVKSGDVATIVAGGGSSDLDKAVRDYADKWTNGVWGNIPYVDGGNDDDDIDNSYMQRDDHRLTTRSTDGKLFKYYKGDICKFLSDTKGTSGSGLTKSWVMPKSEVWKGLDDGGSYDDVNNSLLGTDFSYTPNSSWSDSFSPSTEENGTNVAVDALMTYSLATGETVTFPASGYRNDFSNGPLLGVSIFGYYWSSSVFNASDAYRLGLYNTSVNPAESDGRAYGQSVRCIRE
jgi:hypothetical protein